MAQLSPSRSSLAAILSPGVPLSFPGYKARKYLPELDGLRAIPIFMVITVHMADGVWHWLNGGFGVTVFFVLSGYLITMLGLREEQQRGKMDMRAFYTRRVFRIFPLYYLVLGVYVFLILGVKIAPDKIPGFAPALPFFIFYFPEVATHMGPHGGLLPFYQAWSLGIEEKFYFFWLALAFLFLRARSWPRRTLTALLILVFIFYIYWAPWLGAYRVQSYALILLGAMLALLLEEPAGFAFMQRFAGAMFYLVLPVWFLCNSRISRRAIRYIFTRHTGFLSCCF
ncbi:MAG: acyltransferase [Acidobacteriia bacterium]|nr:acyltransferase [Terriglobia bacterium]